MSDALLMQPAPRRSDKTRDELMAAFTSLLFAKGFGAVSVTEIVTAARHARSTFYEHFSSKEDVLRACMSRFFAIIARCVVEEEEPAKLQSVLVHLFENRRLTDAIFSGAPRAILAQALADMVERHLRDAAGDAPLALPSRLAAIMLAEAQLGLIEAWLRGRAFCSVEHLAGGLHEVGRAGALALLSGDAAQARG